MGATRLRYAADGPFVTGPGGGSSEPGQGFPNRILSMVAGSHSPLSGTAYETLTAAGLAFPAAKEGLRYQASIEVYSNISTAWATIGTVTLVFEYAVDDGSPVYTQMGVLALTYDSADEPWGANAIAAHSGVPILGSDLTGVSEGDNLIFRARIAKAGGADGAFTFPAAPSVYFEVVESL